MRERGHFRTVTVTVHLVIVRRRRVGTAIDATLLENATNVFAVYQRLNPHLTHVSVSALLTTFDDIVEVELRPKIRKHRWDAGHLERFSNLQRR